VTSPAGLHAIGCSSARVGGSALRHFSTCASRCGNPDHERQTTAMASPLVISWEPSNIKMANNWSHEETDDPIRADRRNYYKVEKWSRDGQGVEELLFAETASLRPSASLSGSSPSDPGRGRRSNSERGCCRSGLRPRLSDVGREHPTCNPVSHLNDSQGPEGLWSGDRMIAHCCGERC
jgi:hypothetical protein